MQLTRDQVLTALRQVKDPELHKDIVTLNRVREASVDGTSVILTIELAPTFSSKEALEHEIKASLASIGAERLALNFTGPTGAGAAPATPPKNLPQVKDVIAVGAGKGGVGKSTVAVNLAVGLQRRGFRVGLMDGDIYGPSIPTMLGIRGAVPTVQGSKILPHHVHGIHAVTIGSLVEQDKPLIWRGPMAHGAFKQLLLDNTLWPELDYLIVDLPPGTGDVPLTLCQLLGLTGAVVVATPQQVALDDAIRAVRMFQQLGAPILGMIENMAGDIFGRGGTENAARDLGLPFLGRLDLFADLRVNADAGKPHANFDGDPQLRASLDQIVDHLIEAVHLRNMNPGPKLEIS